MKLVLTWTEVRLLVDLARRIEKQRAAAHERALKHGDEAELHQNIGDLSRYEHLVGLEARNRAQAETLAEQRVVVLKVLGAIRAEEREGSADSQRDGPLVLPVTRRHTLHREN